MPRQPEKDQGQTTTITFLGIELDPENMEVRLPQEKLKKKTEEPSGELEGKESRQEERHALTNKAIDTCRQGGQTSQSICQTPHRLIKHD